jgi:Transglutaminase-like superfamily/Coenzyme PQQ synthesis protein D (PqqD)
MRTRGSVLYSLPLCSWGKIMLSPSPVRPVNTPSERSVPLRVARSVRAVQNKDGAVLLDLHQGICFGMTPVGIKIWELLNEEWSLDQICDRLCYEYADVPRERIADDVGQFVHELTAKKLLTSDQLVPRSTLLLKILTFAQTRQSSFQWSSAKVRLPRFLFWKALLGLAAFDLFRFGSNFCRSYEFVRGWKVPLSQFGTDIVDQVCNAVNYACVWYPKRVLCLQRSVVTTCLLRQCGVPAQMVMGAQKFPFKAHAWTEVDGRPINERRDVQRLYLLWERC